MAIFRAKKVGDYSVISNKFLRDSNLSLKGKGLLAYFLSRPDDWVFYSNEIVKNCKDGVASTANGIQELVSLGYVERIKCRDEEGRYTGGFDYVIYEEPQGNLKNAEGTSTEEGESNEKWTSANNVDTNESWTSTNNAETNDGWTRAKGIGAKDIESISPKCENPNLDNPNSENPNLENPILLNTKYKPNTENKLSTEKTPPCNKKHNRQSGGGNRDIYNFYSENGFGKLNRVVCLVLDSFVKNYSKEALREAMIEAIKNNKYTLSYVEGILKNKKKRLKDKRGSGVSGKSGGSYGESIRNRGIILSVNDL